MKKTLRTLGILCLVVSLATCDTEPRVLGLRLRSVTSSQSYTEEGVISVMAGQEIDIEAEANILHKISRK